MPGIDFLILVSTNSKQQKPGTNSFDFLANCTKQHAPPQCRKLLGLNPALAEIPTDRPGRFCTRSLASIFLAVRVARREPRSSSVSCPEYHAPLHGIPHEQNSLPPKPLSLSPCRLRTGVPASAKNWLRSDAAPSPSQKIYRCQAQPPPNCRAIANQPPHSAPPRQFTKRIAATSVLLRGLVQHVLSLWSPLPGSSLSLITPTLWG